MSMNEFKKTSYNISSILEKHAVNGDSYISEDNLYKLYKRSNKDCTYESFLETLMQEAKQEKIYQDGNKYYLPKIRDYENYVAEKLRGLVYGRWDSSRPLPVIQDGLYKAFTQEQRNAVNLAMHSKISVITGGAGSGKTTLIRSIINNCRGRTKFVLCAPTGKAARNLSEKTGVRARTVHSALRTRPEEDFLSPVVWDHTGMVVVDEASMLTLEMFSGIMSRMSDICKLVLIGDPNQLKPVGIGNVLEDLISLRAPMIHLESNHRQSQVAEALEYNVTKFYSIRKLEDLHFDNSFKLLPMGTKAAYNCVVRDASQSYQRGESIQVLTPFNKKSILSAESLNVGIRNIVNPDREGLGKLHIGSSTFHDGDRVMILKNDNSRECCNGDIGILRINVEDSNYCIDLPDGRAPVWDFSQQLPEIALAYALTIHKSQGSEYDKVIIPIVEEFSCMLNRNLIYTAFSRAIYEIVFYGHGEVLLEALQKQQPARLSGLVDKVLQDCKFNSNIVA